MKGIPHKTNAKLEYTEYMIPKKNGKGRRIFAPSKELLAHQHTLLPNIRSEVLRLEEHYNVQGILQGFMKDRNPVTAAEQHIGYDLTIMMDISNFFDSVNTTKVTSAGIRAGRDYITTSCFHYEKDGLGFTAQGFATSPLLANVAIIPLIAEIKEYLDTKFKDRYAFTVYADDIQISINSSNFIPEVHTIEDIVTFVFENDGYEMNHDKTRVRHAKFGHRRILGINVGDDRLFASRKTMRKLRCAKYQKNWPSAGGLTTWSKCLPPKSLRGPKKVPWVKDVLEFPEFIKHIFEATPPTFYEQYINYIGDGTESRHITTHRSVAPVEAPSTIVRDGVPGTTLSYDQLIGTLDNMNAGQTSRHRDVSDLLPSRWFS